MKAVILSAGQGKRLLPLTENMPKCLLPVGADTHLLDWQLDQLAAAGVDEAVVVTGFEADKVARELERPRPGIAARGLFNPRYATADNLASVFAALDEMDDDVVLLNGDTLFEAAVVRRLIDAPRAAIRVMVSRKPAYDDDDMKVRLEGERLRAVGKTLDAATVDAESIGMMLFRGSGARRFREAVTAAMQAESGARLWYLSVIDALAGEMDIQVSEAAQHEWCEVDFPVDLRRARDAVARWSAASREELASAAVR